MTNEDRGDFPRTVVELMELFGKMPGPSKVYRVDVKQEGEQEALDRLRLLGVTLRHTQVYPMGKGLTLVRTPSMDALAEEIQKRGGKIFYFDSDSLITDDLDFAREVEKGIT